MRSAFSVMYCVTATLLMPVSYRKRLILTLTASDFFDSKPSDQ